jgi:uncharacterized membrane protein YhaH (DUF805 family)
MIDPELDQRLGRIERRIFWIANMIILVLSAVGGMLIGDQIKDMGFSEWWAVAAAFVGWIVLGALTMREFEKL